MHKIILLSLFALSIQFLHGNCSLEAPLNISLSNPGDIAFSPKGKCLAVASLSLTTIYIYSFDKKNCSISSTPVSMGNIPAGIPLSLAFSPNGKCLAVFNGFTNTINIFSFDLCTCQISQNPTQVIFTGGVLPSQPTFTLQTQIIAFSPEGNCIAVANQLAKALQIYSFDQETCSITNGGNPVGSIPMNLPGAVVFEQCSNKLAATNALADGSSQVILYSINENNCKLTQESVVNLANSTSPLGAAFSPDGHCLAVTDLLANSLSFIKVSDHELTLLETFNNYTSNPYGLAYAPDGRCLYVANLFEIPSTISILTINKHNCLPCSSKFVPSGGTGPVEFAFSKNGKCLAVSNISSGNVSIFRQCGK